MNQRRTRIDCLKTPSARVPPAGPGSLAVLTQETGKVLGGRPADIEDGGVGDTGGPVKPLVLWNLIFADPSPPGLHACLTGHEIANIVTRRNRQVTEKISLHLPDT